MLARGFAPLLLGHCSPQVAHSRTTSGPQFPSTCPKTSWEIVLGGLGEAGAPSGLLNGHRAPQTCCEVLGQGMSLALTPAHAIRPWEKLNDAPHLVTPAVLCQMSDSITRPRLVVGSSHRAQARLGAASSTHLAQLQRAVLCGLPRHKRRAGAAVNVVSK